MTTTDGNSFVQALLDSRRMAQVSAYLSRGRRFREGSDDQIREAWATAFESALGRGDRSQRGDLEDLFAELHVRGLEAPSHLVKDTMERLANQMRQRPDVAKEAAREVIGQFMESLRTPRN